jgi:hypothetical protein
MSKSTISTTDDQGNIIKQNTNVVADNMKIALDALAGSNLILREKSLNYDKTASALSLAKSNYDKSITQKTAIDSNWDGIVGDLHNNKGVDPYTWNRFAASCRSAISNKIDKNTILSRADSANQTAKGAYEIANANKLNAEKVLNNLKNDDTSKNADGSKRTASSLTDALEKEKNLKSLNLNCYTETVNTGEVCTISSAMKYNIFDKIKYFDNSKLPEQDIFNIDKHINNAVDKTLPYSLCSIDDNNANVAIENCVLSYDNPWKTLKKPGSSNCSLPNKIELPPGLSYDKTGDIIIPDPIFRHKTKVGYCQEKWYDWFTIPDYHLGNKVTVLNQADKPRNILKCYKPCNIGYIPRDNNNILFINNCVLKDYYNYGLYKGTFHYLPISLILLLGSTEESLKSYYRLTLNNAKQNIIDNNLILDHEVYNNLYNDSDTFSRLYNNNSDPNDRGIKFSIKNRINELFTIPFEVENIIVPDNNVIEISKPIITKIKIQQAYDICKKLYDLSVDAKKQTLLNEWLTSLASVSDQDTNCNKFKKQLLILKKACNVTFDGKTPYSKDYILYNLNKDIDINEVPNPPIEFNLKLSHVLYSSNLPFGSPATSGVGGGAGGAAGGGSGGAAGTTPEKPQIKKTQAHEFDNIINFTPFCDSYLKYKDTYSKLKIFIAIIFICMLISLCYVLFCITQPFLLMIINFIYVLLRDVLTMLTYDTVGHFFGFRRYKADVYNKYVSESDKNNAINRVTKVQNAIDKKIAYEKELAEKAARKAAKNA